MPEFQIHILNLQWPDLRHRYLMEEVWPQLATVSLADSPFVLTEDDIRAYDWEQQEIWLSDLGMARIGPIQAKALFHSALGRAFVVTLHGQRLYGGVVYEAYSPPAIRFPVLHAFGAPIEFLRIRPGLCQPWDPTNPYLAGVRQVIANPTLEKWLADHELIRQIPPERRPAEPGLWSPEKRSDPPFGAA
jgi:hypothetical protein